ncbi:low molecular weight protein-tyrosine-phosphatase [Candidatus Protochlamydia amoebophila]|nr:low molecular weight protein-tyrosine-phosphatase [Candidatus Protochlamydia amoebophila]
MMETINVLFVCMGNICRSPAAEGILRHFAKKEPDLAFHIESCGMGDWHVGHSPDVRMQEAAKSRGIILTSQAQQFQKEFFNRFDYILVADKEVLESLYQHAKSTEQKSKIMFMTEYSQFYQGQEVPDPYYQPGGAFELVLDILEDSCVGLLNHIRVKEEKK